jgi:hypothetical protein
MVVVGSEMHGVALRFLQSHSCKCYVDIKCVMRQALTS